MEVRLRLRKGFWKNSDVERVRNTPLCESAIVGAALGLSLEGYKSVMEMQFADFAAVGFNQIVNNLAKIHYRWGQQPMWSSVCQQVLVSGQGPFIPKAMKPGLRMCPGLKVVYPSTPADAKGLLNAAILDPNPVLFFEHKVLYRSISGPLPEQLLLY